MGMYNEVYKSCPYCGKTTESQIPQVVLGFGEFNLDDPESIAKRLTVEETQQLVLYVKDKNFYCQQCGSFFKCNTKKEDHQEKIELLKELL